QNCAERGEKRESLSLVDEGQVRLIQGIETGAAAERVEDGLVSAVALADLGDVQGEQVIPVDRHRLKPDPRRRRRWIAPKAPARVPAPPEASRRWLPASSLLRGG